MKTSKKIINEAMVEIERFYDVKHVDYSQEYIVFGDDAKRYYLVFFINYIQQRVCLREDKVVNEDIDSQVLTEDYLKGINGLLERNF